MADGSSVSEVNIEVRVGTPGDLDPMMKLAVMAADEAGVREPDSNLLLQDIWPALHLDKGIVGIIGAPGAPIEGAVLLRVGTLWYTNEPMLEERSTYVHPAYRHARGGRASKLCEFSMKASQTLGMPLTIGVLSNYRTQAKVRMYRRMLGPPAGAYWLFGIEQTDKHHHPLNGGET